MHAADELPPVNAFTVPAGHARQPALCGSAYVPAGHAAHDAPEPPVEHDRHADEPAPANVPCAHAVHTVALVLPLFGFAVLATHSVHSVAAAPE